MKKIVCSVFVTLLLLTSCITIKVAESPTPSASTPTAQPTEAPTQEPTIQPTTQPSSEDSTAPIIKDGIFYGYGVSFQVPEDWSIYEIPADLNTIIVPPDYPDNTDNINISLIPSYEGLYESLNENILTVHVENILSGSPEDYQPSVHPDFFEKYEIDSVPVVDASFVIMSPDLIYDLYMQYFDIGDELLHIFCSDVSGTSSSYYANILNTISFDPEIIDVQETDEPINLSVDGFEGNGFKFTLPENWHYDEFWEAFVPQNDDIDYSSIYYMELPFTMTNAEIEDFEDTQALVDYYLSIYGSGHFEFEQFDMRYEKINGVDAIIYTYLVTDLTTPAAPITMQLTNCYYVAQDYTYLLSYSDIGVIHEDEFEESLQSFELTQ